MLSVRETPQRTLFVTSATVFSPLALLFSGCRIFSMVDMSAELRQSRLGYLDGRSVRMWLVFFLIASAMGMLFNRQARCSASSLGLFFLSCVFSLHTWHFRAVIMECARPGTPGYRRSCFLTRRDSAQSACLRHGMKLPTAPPAVTFRYHGPPMNFAAKPSDRSRRRAWRDILFYGLCGGVLITLLRWTEYRFLVLEHSVEIYGGLVAAIFSGLGIWLGLTLTRRKTPVDVQQAAPEAGLFTVDQQRVLELGITPRELEILGLIAAGLSNREIAERLFVSENTVKTHSSRLFEKLGAKRRTQVVQFGKKARLIP
jgi:DNA-binding CsgD family transcriptional regulator